MSIRVRVPTPLRGLASGQDVLSITGENLLQCIDSLENQYPGFRDRLCDESGELRRFVNIYVNGEDVRFLEGITTPLKAGDEVSIVPAVAGG
ncbi:MAG: ubiquitin-like small modifier protein 1 [Chloroflexota bacterium]